LKIALFSQSLFALPLDEAISVAARIGYPALELACTGPHFDIELARHEPEKIAARVDEAGLEVSALSLFNTFTDRAQLDEQIETAATFIALAQLLDTHVVKLTPGPPGSAAATEEHWQCLGEAVSRLVPIAQEAGVRLAFETHMRQLTDTLASSQRLLALAPPDILGLTVDFSNLAFAGEKMADVVSALSGRIYNTHVKNGYIDADGGWHFQAIDQGLTDYAEVLPLLRDTGYDGYLSVECLGQDAAERPAETARRDLEILQRLLQEVGWTAGDAE